MYSVVSGFMVGVLVQRGLLQSLQGILLARNVRGREVVELEGRLCNEVGVYISNSRYEVDM